MNTVSNVWLIRHGESEANAGLPTLNPAKTPLTAKGHHQSQQVAQYLARFQPPDLIVTSPYWRTQQTAQPTRERFPEVLHQEWRVQEFTYLAPKRYQGSTIEQRRPLSDAYWLKNDPVYVDGDGAESFIDLIGRAQVTHRQIRELSPGFTVIFSHGRYIRALLWVMLMQLAKTPVAQLDARQMRQFQHFINSFSVPNGSILKLRVDSSDRDASTLNASTLNAPELGIPDLDATNLWFSGIEIAHLLEQTY
jgi:2,3-bisphosphoglycerate-dependent phosphoglycerate mutase